MPVGTGFGYTEKIYRVLRTSFYLDSDCAYSFMGVSGMDTKIAPERGYRKPGKIFGSRKFPTIEKGTEKFLLNSNRAGGES